MAQKGEERQNRGRRERKWVRSGGVDLKKTVRAQCFERRVRETGGKEQKC